MNQYEMIGISEKVMELASVCEEELKNTYILVDEVCEYNSMKVMKAFWETEINESAFHNTSGYGYNDVGRDSIEKIYAHIFKTEDALVRSQMVSGSHALSTCLFALLRPNDILLSITGLPYDTLHEVIGIKENKSSLKSFGIHYNQIDLVENDFDYARIEE